MLCLLSFGTERSMAQSVVLDSQEEKVVTNFSWTLKDLHDHLHVDGGLGLRIMTHKAVCRIGFAVGEEGFRVTAMYGHPF